MASAESALSLMSKYVKSDSSSAATDPSSAERKLSDPRLKYHTLCVRRE